MGKAYKCIVCEHKTHKAYNLARHAMLKHNINMPFVCQVCQKSFKTVDLAKRHQLIHSAVRPFDCEICGRTFKRRDHCKSHKKKCNRTADHTAATPHSELPFQVRIVLSPVHWPANGDDLHEDGVDSVEAAGNVETIEDLMVDEAAVAEVPLVER